MAILTSTRSKVSARVVLGVVAVAAAVGAIAYFGVLPKIKTETREVTKVFDLTDENQALDIFPASGQDFYVNYRNDLKNEAGEAMPAGLALDTSAYAESQAACLENQFFSDCQVKELPNNEMACAEAANRQVRFTADELKYLEKEVAEAKTPTEKINAQTKKIKYYLTSESGALEAVKVYLDDFTQNILSDSSASYKYSDAPAVYKLHAEVLASDGQVDTELTNKITWRYMTTDAGVAMAGPNGEIFPVSIGETKMHASACGKTAEVTIDTKTPEENKQKIRTYNQYSKLPTDLLSGFAQSSVFEIPGKKEEEYISKITLSPEILSGLSAEDPQFILEILASNDSGRTWVKEKNNQIINHNTNLSDNNPLVFEFPQKSASLRLAIILKTEIKNNGYFSADIIKAQTPNLGPGTLQTFWYNVANNFFGASSYVKDIYLSYPSYSTFYNSLEYWKEQNKGERGLVIAAKKPRKHFYFQKIGSKNEPLLDVPANLSDTGQHKYGIIYMREYKKVGDTYENFLFSGNNYAQYYIHSVNPSITKFNAKFLDETINGCQDGSLPNCYVVKGAEAYDVFANEAGYGMFISLYYHKPKGGGIINATLAAVPVLVLPQSSPIFSKLQVKANLSKETVEKPEKSEITPLPEQLEDPQYPVEKVTTDASTKTAEWLLQNPKVAFRGEGRVIINWKSDQEKLIEAPVFLFGSSAENLDKKANVYYDQKSKKFYAILWNLKEGKENYFKLVSNDEFSETQKFNAPTRFQNILYLYNIILGANLNLAKYQQPDKSLRGGGPHYYWQSTLSYDEIKLSLLFDAQYREFDKRLAKSAAKQGTKKQVERLYRIIYDKIYPNNLAKIAEEKTVNSYLKKVNRKDNKKITLTGVKFALAKKFFEKNVLKNYSKDKRPAALAYFLVLHRQDALGIDYLAKKYGKNNKAMRRELIEGKEFMSKLNMIEQKYGQETAIEEIYEAFNAKPITAEKLTKFAVEKPTVQDIQKKILQGEWK